MRPSAWLSASLGSHLDEGWAKARLTRQWREVPPHGTLARVRQHIPADRAAGPADPGGVPEPVWLTTHTPAEGPPS